MTATQETTGDVLTEAVRQTAKAAGGSTGSSEIAAKDSEAPAEGQGIGDAAGDTETEGEKTGDEGKTEDAPAAFVKADGTPFTKADHDGLTGALAAARKEAKDHKRDLDALRAAAGGKTADDIRGEAVAETEGTWRPRVVRLAARTALTEAGLNLPAGRETEAFTRALRLLDVDTLTISDEGDVDGLADQIAALRGDFPDLFARQRQAPPRVQAGERAGAGKSTPTAAERLAASLIRA